MAIKLIYDALPLFLVSKLPNSNIHFQPIYPHTKHYHITSINE